MRRGQRRTLQCKAMILITTIRGVDRFARFAMTTVATVALLTSCAVGTEYSRPEVAIPAAFKEAPVHQTAPSLADAAVSWKTAEPADDTYRGEWWKVFSDRELDALEYQALAGNQDIQAAASRVEQARALTQASRSSWFPQVGAGFGPTREGLSAPSMFQPQGTGPLTMTLWRAQGTISYEADLFGRVSRHVEAVLDDEAQSEALLRSVQLALQADVAQHYFTLRKLDADQVVYQQTVSLREDALNIARRRLVEGEINVLDLSRAKTELASVQADAVGVERKRAACEHALAILLGKAPADFTFSVAPIAPVEVIIPAGLPSSLLERRPDIAAAEHAMAAANARIGLAKSAFFPRLQLTGSFGFEAATLGDLFLWSSRAFLLGPLAGTVLTAPIFDGGQRSGRVREARAQYDERVAMYLERVLGAFREVEDNLSELHLLGGQIQMQGDAVSASRQAAKLSRMRYLEGEVSYLDVIETERSVLFSQLRANELIGAQATATVDLIRALGGGWGH
jgi:outer membrane protein, multidrug efflux system